LFCFTGNNVHVAIQVESQPMLRRG
jgi:hypothetical protein